MRNPDLINCFRMSSEIECIDLESVSAESAESVSTESAESVEDTQACRMILVKVTRDKGDLHETTVVL